MLERCRQLFEDSESLERAACESLLREGRTAGQRVHNQHAAAHALAEQMEVHRTLVDALGERGLQEEVQQCKGVDGETFSRFYAQLEQLKAYHQRFPFVSLRGARAAEPAEGEEEEERLEAQLGAPVVAFSGAESHGRHLDLHSFYDTFLNLKVSKLARDKDPAYSLTYRMYVGSFYVFSSADAAGKDEEYLHYLLDLLAYLVDFLQRAQPLLDVRRTLDSIALDTQTKWDDGTQRAWDGGGGAGAGAGAASDPLYCKACDKRFAKQSVFDGHLGGKKHIAAAKKMGGEGGAAKALLEKKVFLEEMKIHRLVTDTLQDVVTATVAEIEKKQARTLREQLEAMDHNSEDDLVEEDDVSDEDEEDQGFVKQIRNYPVGWDGEPIPYWLYRLHGLGVEYKCEICGNTSYWGRRAFEKHFEEYKHQNGMKLLGLPNTPHFFDVTRIKDALELHKKLEAEEKAKSWNPDEMMEMEDDQGRVYDKKTFEMLKKQGVIREKKA